MEIKCVYATETPREIESVYDSNMFFWICEKKFFLFIIPIKILIIYWDSFMLLRQII